MKNIIKTIVSVSVSMALMLGGFGVANAQVYYNTSTPAYTNAYAGYSNCVSFAYTFGYGYHDVNTGGNIAVLQNFLATQGYMSSGLATGYFGYTTQTALRQYQAAHYLPLTGQVDDATRLAIQNQTCGANYNNGYNYNNYNGNNGYGYNGNYYPYQNVAPTISSVNGPTSLTTGNSGTWTIQLSNRNSNNNVTTSVRWGDENYYYANYASAQNNYYNNQQSLTFTHTYNTSGTYTIVFTVTDSVTGLQNTSSVTVNVTNYNYYNNNYNNNCYYNYGYNNNCYSNGGAYGTNQPWISYLSPNSGRSGTQILIEGSGFTPWGNTIYFDGITVPNISSSNNGQEIYYSIPYSMAPGTYPIYVTNSYGQTTSTANFTVTYY